MPRAKARWQKMVQASPTVPDAGVTFERVDFAGRRWCDAHADNLALPVRTMNQDRDAIEARRVRHVRAAIRRRVGNK